MTLRPVPFVERAEDVLAFLRQRHNAGEGCALCVVTGVSGGSARAVGTLVAVSAGGQMAGYVSHGCVDADLAVQAVDAIASGTPRQLVYGTGSPFMDLRLPCGGTVEILIDPAPNPGRCAQALDGLQARKSVTLAFQPKTGLSGVQTGAAATEWRDGSFHAHHRPVLRLVVAGSGPVLAAVAALARSMGFPLALLSPDPLAGDYAPEASFHHLTSASDIPDLALDPHTAVLLLFHDHDWEPPLLRAALDSPAFYIGALGSARTQAARLDALRSAGIGDAALSRINGPIGLIGAARDAQTLSLSALAEIVAAYRAAT